MTMSVGEPTRQEPEVPCWTRSGLSYAGSTVKIRTAIGSCRRHCHKGHAHCQSGKPSLYVGNDEPYRPGSSMKL
jgi:hypothetical protein